MNRDLIVDACAVAVGVLVAYVVSELLELRDDVDQLNRWCGHHVEDHRIYDTKHPCGCTDAELDRLADDMANTNPAVDFEPEKTGVSGGKG